MRPGGWAWNGPSFAAFMVAAKSRCERVSRVKRPGRLVPTTRWGFPQDRGFLQKRPLGWCSGSTFTSMPAGRSCAAILSRSRARKLTIQTWLCNFCNTTRVPGIANEKKGKRHLHPSPFISYWKVFLSAITQATALGNRPTFPPVLRHPPASLKNLYSTTLDYSVRQFEWRSRQHRP
jgi:hypothetical protein